MNKKQMLLTALMTVAVTGLSQAQTYYPALGKFTPAQKERIEKMYTFALSSDNRGLVESTLEIVTMMKLDLPADNFPMISAKIEDLKSSSETAPTVRYKAFLASAVFADPASFKLVAAPEYGDPDAFFAALDRGSDQTSFSEKQ